jgi:hypothetical protein
LDGVYDARGRFTPLPAPTRDEMHALTTRIAERITRLCDRRALEAELPETERSLCAAFARSAARRGATAHAPEDAEPDTTPDHALRLEARVDGFDLDATTVVRAEDRERLEPSRGERAQGERSEPSTCVQVSPAPTTRRPPLAPPAQRPGGARAQDPVERRNALAHDERGHVRGGQSANQKRSLERLCSLVPRPSTHQVIHRGVLASHAAWRPRVVPRPDDDLGPRPKNATFCVLMKHGLGLDVLACPCGGRMKYLATIFDRTGLQRLLRAKGLPHFIEHAKPARAPPQAELDFGAGPSARPRAQRRCTRAPAARRALA